MQIEKYFAASSKTSPFILSSVIHGRANIDIKILITALRAAPKTSAENTASEVCSFFPAPR